MFGFFRDRRKKKEQELADRNRRELDQKRRDDQSRIPNKAGVYDTRVSRAAPAGSNPSRGGYYGGSPTPVPDPSLDILAAAVVAETILSDPATSPSTDSPSPPDDTFSGGGGSFGGGGASSSWDSSPSSSDYGSSSSSDSSSSSSYDSSSSSYDSGSSSSDSSSSSSFGSD